MREHDRWGKHLKEEVQEVTLTENMKQQVLQRVSTSWLNREVKLPISLVGGIMALSLLIALSPLYGEMSMLNNVNVSSKPQASYEQDFVKVNDMYVQRSLLVWGDQP